MKKPSEDDLTVLTMHALVAARDAFQAYLARDGSDSAYWDYRFTAWELTTDDFQRLERVELEHEVKEKT